MTDDELLRYSRQIILNDFGVEKQQILKESTVLIIGIGGLGAINSQYLASSGVGRLILADFDKVELSNLGRQIIHHTEDINKLKIVSAKEKLSRINPEIQIDIIKNVEENLDCFKEANIILDGTDNFETRFQINELAIKYKKPLVSAAVIKTEGQVSTFMGYGKNNACYECLYKRGITTNNNCTENGVLAPMVGMIGSLQALETIKILTKMSDNLVNNLLLIDGSNYSFRRVKINKDKLCFTCAKR